MVTLYVAIATSPSESTSLICGENSAATVGVPEIVFVPGLKVTPVGSPVMVHELPPEPPLEVTGIGPYGTPTVQLGNEVGELMKSCGGGVPIVMPLVPEND